MIEVNKSFLDPIVINKKRYPAYELTVDIANHLKFHIDGYNYNEKKQAGEKDNPYFTKLIDTRRPSESDHIQEYRRKIYLPITKQPCYKVINSLKKGVKSSDWKIDFTQVEKIPSIREGEDLETYTSKKFPYTNSVESWLYNLGLKEILSDPNGLIVTLPVSYDVKNTDFRKPYPSFISSDKIYDYSEGEYAVYESNKTYEYTSVDGTSKIKDFLIYAVTKEAVYEVRKVNSKGDYTITEVLKLNFDRLPVRRAGGIYKCIIDNSVVYDSFLSPILPGLDAAARESSDLDAEVVQHIFSTMWYYASQECNTCNGTGKLTKAGNTSVCGKCEGNGTLTKSPYKDLIVKPPAIDQQAMRAPFAGYIEKNTEIVKIQDERIDSHIYKALSAVNMEFLATTPLSQSGKAKEVDKDELNNFVYGVYYHLVENILVPIYKDTNDIRVMDMGITEEKREKMIPKIPVPERFEILTENYLQEQVVSAKTGNLDPLIVNGLELDFACKKFEYNYEIKNKIIVSKQFNPFPALNPEEVDNGVLSGTISKEDAVLYKYLATFIEDASHEVEGFFELDYDKKKKVLDKYTSKVMGELSISNKIVNEITGEGGIDTPVDVEAEAKANLKGSVGGVQGLIQIQNSVAQGITDYESAVTMLFEIYGFDEATARKLLGDKKALESKMQKKADDLKQSNIINANNRRPA